MQLRRFPMGQNASPYKQLQYWRERRQAIASNAQSVTAAASSAFASAHINQSAGMAGLAAQAALKNAHDQIKTKISSLGLDKLA